MARTYSLDLLDQWRGFEESGEWRSTPPTHVAQALRAGLVGLQRETVAGGRTICRDLRRIGGCGRSASRRSGAGAAEADLRGVPNERLIPDGISFADYYAPARGRAVHLRPVPRGERSFRVGCIGRIEPHWVDELEEATAASSSARLPRSPGGNRPNATPPRRSACRDGARRAGPPVPFPPSQPANDATAGPGSAAVRLIRAEGVDTVLVCMVDMQGRLAGKRMTARHFLEDARTRTCMPATTCWASTSTCSRSRACRPRAGSWASATSPSGRTSRPCASCPGCPGRCWSWATRWTSGRAGAARAPLHAQAPARPTGGGGLPAMMASELEFTCSTATGRKRGEATTGAWPPTASTRRTIRSSRPAPRRG